MRQSIDKVVALRWNFARTAIVMAVACMLSPSLAELCSMRDTETEIRAIVDRETLAWDTQNVELLLSVLHPDMVWPWPPNARAHDPNDWVFPFGRFNRERWRRSWQTLFDTHKLIHNRREIRRIAVSDEHDGAFAVVDVDTLWRNGAGVEQQWKGRACKIYTRVSDEWKMIAQTGLLDYT